MHYAGAVVTHNRLCCLQRGAKEAGKQAGDAAHQGADFAADKTEEAGAAAEDYSKTGADKVVGFSSYLSNQSLDRLAICLRSLCQGSTPEHVRQAT